MLWQSVLCSQVTQLYTYGHSFPILFHYGLSPDIECFPALYSRTLLFLHTIYNSLHLLIPSRLVVAKREGGGGGEKWEFGIRSGI